MTDAQVVERKLAVILAADVAEYSRLMGVDEVGTLRTLQAYRAILDRLIAAHHGRIFNTAGDSVMADFASAVDAVECAVDAQETIAKQNADRAAGEQMRFRIGVHLGDVIVDGTNLFGDGVNIAARLEAMAAPGGICLSGAVRDQIGTRLPIAFIPLGEQRVKNITEPVRAAQLIGNGPDVLLRIDAIGSDFDTWAGTCGKSGQGVPVSSGQPPLRVAEMTVGGTSA